jgi:hypothetical protein
VDHTPAKAGPRRRRVLLGFGALGGGALLALLLVAGQAWLFVHLGWPNREPLHNPAFGINFSCNQAEYLLLEDPAKGAAGYVSDNRPGRVEWCAETLHELLSWLGARYVRISVEWSQVAPEPEVLDFTLVDALLDTAAQDGAKVLLSVGMKAQRHPEFYIPDWVLRQSRESATSQLGDGAEISRDPVVRAAAEQFVAAVVAHVAARPEIDGWLADNEPYLASPRAHNWTLGRDFVAEEAAIIRRGDPLGRPIVENHAEHFTFDRRWRWTMADADIIGTSIYPFRNYELFGAAFVVPVLEMGPLTPNYAARARETHELGKQFWITELQAEPWADPDVRLFSPDHPAPDLTVANFRKNIEYARRTAADRVYLWGAEWWLYQREKFRDGTWWEIARAALGGDQASLGAN